MQKQNLKKGLGCKNRTGCVSGSDKTEKKQYQKNDVNRENEKNWYRARLWSSSSWPNPFARWLVGAPSRTSHFGLGSVPAKKSTRSSAGQTEQLNLIVQSKKPTWAVGTTWNFSAACGSFGFLLRMHLPWLKINERKKKAQISAGSLSRQSMDGENRRWELKSAGSN